MIEHLKLLKEGKSIECPTYDYTIRNRSRNTLTIAPGKVIIVEGILIFENKKLCEQMDIHIFVDTDDDLRIIRRIRRGCYGAVKKSGFCYKSVPQHSQTDA